MPPHDFNILTDLETSFKSLKKENRIKSNPENVLGIKEGASLKVNILKRQKERNEV